MSQPDESWASASTNEGMSVGLRGFLQPSDNIPTWGSLEYCFPWVFASETELLSLHSGNIPDVPCPDDHISLPTIGSATSPPVTATQSTICCPHMIIPVLGGLQEMLLFQLCPVKTWQRPSQQVLVCKPQPLTWLLCGWEWRVSKEHTGKRGCEARGKDWWSLTVLGQNAGRQAGRVTERFQFCSFPFAQSKWGL